MLHAVTDNLHFKTSQHLKLIKQSYLVGSISFLTADLNEITLFSEKKNYGRITTGSPLDLFCLFLNHYPLVWGNSNRLSRSLDLHWKWPVRLDDSLHECLTRLSTEFSPCLFFSFFLHLVLCYPFLSLVLKPIQLLFIFMPWLLPILDLCPFASLMKHAGPVNLESNFYLHWPNDGVIWYIVNTQSQKSKQNVICKRKTKENRHLAHNFRLVW